MSLGRSRWRARNTLLAMGFVAMFLASSDVAANADADSAADDDAMRVYCLAPEQRDAMREAAVALGFAHKDDDGDYRLKNGVLLEPASWREDSPADFDRTCSALMAARGRSAPVTGQPPTEPSFMVTLLPFLTGLSSAVLAFAAAAWRERVSRGRVLADDLRLRFEEFRKAATAYLGSWTPSRSDEQVVDRRGALLTQLARVRALRPRWPQLRSLEAALTTGTLGADLTRNRTSQDHKQAADVAQRLDEVRDSLFGLAHAVEHPLRTWWAARGRAGAKP